MTLAQFHQGGGKCWRGALPRASRWSPAARGRRVSPWPGGSAPRSYDALKAASWSAGHTPMVGTSSTDSWEIVPTPGGEGGGSARTTSSKRRWLRRVVHVALFILSVMRDAHSAKTKIRSPEACASCAGFVSMTRIHESFATYGVPLGAAAPHSMSMPSITTTNPAHESGPTGPHPRGRRLWCHTVQALEPCPVSSKL